MKTKVFVILICVFPFSFVSCEKDESVSVEIIQEENLVDIEEELFSLGEFAPDADVLVAKNEASQKSLDLNVIQNAKNYNDIPTKAYRCYDLFKPWYVHIRQPDNQSCSWTAYVICAGNIANAVWWGYPQNVSKVYAVKSGCGSSKTITSLANYCNSVDKNNYYLRAQVLSNPKINSSYLDVIKRMLTLLEETKTPFVTIAKSGSKAHYVTVYSIHWKKGLKGSLIYFTDSLDPDRGSFNNNIKSMDLEDFLYSMKSNSNTYYNFLRILP